MSETRDVPAAVARRFLVLRHLLAPPRGLPARRNSVLDVVTRIGTLQFDPLEVAGRNHDLVLLARVAGYRREWTDDWLYADRRLYETYNKGLSIVPVAELPWYRLTWDQNRLGVERRPVFDSHPELMEELLSKIREGGPLLPRDVGPREAIDWYWRPTNQVRAMLEALAEAGILGIARREGNLRVYDLVERLFPADVLVERRPEEEQLRHRLLSRYRGNGLLGAGGQSELWYGAGRYASDRTRLRDRLVADGDLVAVQVDGVRGVRYVVADDLPFLDQAEREVGEGLDPGGRPPGVALLAPLDPLCWDRGLLRSLFGFDYVWEVYVPAAKRRWGYYVLPLLYGDRLVGRIEPRIERRAGTLRIAGIWWEAGFDPLAEPGFVAALANAVAAHRDFADLDSVTFPSGARERDLRSAVRGALAVRGSKSTAVGRCAKRPQPRA